MFKRNETYIVLIVKSSDEECNSGGHFGDTKTRESASQSHRPAGLNLLNNLPLFCTKVLDNGGSYIFYFQSYTLFSRFPLGKTKECNDNCGAYSIW